MKKLSILLILMVCVFFLRAQSPQKFNYQGIARQNTGEVIPDQAISIRASILQNSPSGPSQYVETHSLTTNQLGLFTTQIGGGSTVSGNFANITWGDGEKFLEIEIDPTGGTNYTLSGTFQLMSVPYSLQSRNTEQLQGNPLSPTPPADQQILVWDAGAGEWVPTDDAGSIVYTAGPGIDINGSNQISNTAPDQVVTIDGSGETTVSGAYPNFTVNTPMPADNSATNEIQTLSIAGSNLTLSNGGGTVTLPAEVDGSVTNELQTLSLNGNTLSLSSGGGSVTLNNGINYNAGIGIDITGDVISNIGDLNNTNELQLLSLAGNTLSLSNGGGSVTLNNGINYNAGLGIDITGNVISNIGDLNASNEIQLLSLNGNTLSLSNGGGSVTLNNGINYTPGFGIDITGDVISNTGDGDSDSANEIQALSLNGTTLSLSNGGGSVEIPEAPVYTAGVGIAIDGNNVISNTGDLDDSDDITTATIAGGDLDGMYPDPTVDGLRGNPISTDPPGLGYVLQWDGDAWTPTDPGTQSDAWLLTGNATTDSITNFIGTVDERPLQFRIHNFHAGKLSFWDGNTFLGLQAGLQNTTGFSNTAFGWQALVDNTEGNGNTAIGLQALALNTLGEGNTASGLFALVSNTEGDYNSAFGTQSLLSNTIGALNTAVGLNSLFSNTEGDFNTATGALALQNNTIGESNVAIGVEALGANTEGNFNTAVGVLALASNTTGVENIAIGQEALVDNTTGDDNIAIGVLSLLSNTIGHDNVSMGFQSLIANTEGNFNTATGNTSLAFNTTGEYNTAHGFQALVNTDDGEANTASGANALFTNTTGSDNTGIGFQADVSVGTLTNATAIGSFTTVNASNKIRLGNTNVSVIEGQVAYSFPSDARFKFNVNEEVKGLDFITRLRPVNYQFDTQKYTEFLNVETDEADFSASSNTVHTGFLAQEVVQAAQESGYTFDGVHIPADAQDNYSVAYSQFVVPLVKAVQEQQEMIETQDEELAKLRAELEEIKALLKKEK